MATGLYPDGVLMPISLAVTFSDVFAATEYSYVYVTFLISGLLVDGITILWMLLTVADAVPSVALIDHIEVPEPAMPKKSYVVSFTLLTMPLYVAPMALPLIAFAAAVVSENVDDRLVCILVQRLYSSAYVDA